MCSQAVLIPLPSNRADCVLKLLSELEPLGSPMVLREGERCVKMPFM